MLNTKNSLMLYEAKKARHKPHIVLQILIFIAVFLVANVATGLVVGIPMGLAMIKSIDPALIAGGDIAAVAKAAMASFNDMPEWFIIIALFATAISTVCTFIYCRKIEGRSFASMGMKKEGFLKEYGLGYLVGAVMLASAVGLSMLLGGTSFAGFNAGVSYLYVLLFFAGFMVQGMSEEVLVRGYFMISCANKVHIAVAVGLSSVLFSALHLANNGITPLAFVNLVLFGVFAAVYMLRTDNLWGACALHASWNFLQGHIFGISVSGGLVCSSVFGTEFIEGRELVSGGGFGIEGGICTTMVLLAGIALVLFLPQKPRPELPQEEYTPEKETAHASPMPVYIEK